MNKSLNFDTVLIEVFSVTLDPSIAYQNVVWVLEKTKNIKQSDRNEISTYLKTVKTTCPGAAARSRPAGIRFYIWVIRIRPGFVYVRW
jgi:hypothetical protein